jgi:hypothetical protein
MKKFFDLISANDIGVIEGRFRSAVYGPGDITQWAGKEDRKKFRYINILLEKNEEMLGIVTQKTVDKISWAHSNELQICGIYITGKNSKRQIIDVEISLTFVMLHNSGNFYATRLGDVSFKTHKWKRSKISHL